MVLSFVYLAFVALLKLLLRGGRRVEVSDLELLVLRHQVGRSASSGRAPGARTE
jgi:hypothetical protein